MKRIISYFRKHPSIFLFIGIISALILFLSGRELVHITSTDSYCNSCHAHPNATTTWKLSTHYDNQRGIIVHCTDCHLPPQGHGYLSEKIRFGIKDLYGHLFKDISKINWEEKSTLKFAKNFTFKESCIKCHQNLFPLTLSKKGDEAHLYYNQKQESLRCLNCHLYVGHYTEASKQTQNIEFGKDVVEKEIYTSPARIEKFEHFTEYIPGSSVKFEMIAIPGGTFFIGSTTNEPYREEHEGPQKEVKISPFFMGKVEVSWDEYLAFYKQTSTGDKHSEGSDEKTIDKNPDAITGATPPYGTPDQGWGMGSRPAITMTHFAAETYCKWLSATTGKKYRLPTEAEWEYACRAGTESPFFIVTNADNQERKRFFRKKAKLDTTDISRYVNYIENSNGKTTVPLGKKPNPFGLINMAGNVSEFCSDWYSPDSYSQYSGIVIDPKGPEFGIEHIIRGGSFKSPSKNIRSASRDYTKTDEWLITDPQIPKSIWWYSDCNHVGFRVVCEYEENLK